MSTDRYRNELLAAGWIAETPTRWKSPLGKLYIGPYGAWRAMKIIRGWSEKNRDRDVSIDTMNRERA